MFGCKMLTLELCCDTNLQQRHMKFMKSPDRKLQRFWTQGKFHQTEELRQRVVRLICDTLPFVAFKIIHVSFVK